MRLRLMEDPTMHRSAIGRFALVLIIAGCASKPDSVSINEGVPTMQLSSSAFREGETIPKNYTGQGADGSPPLSWEGAPVGTKSFALICDDPDAPGGTWTHWVLYGIPADTRALQEGIPPQETLPNGSRQGINSWTSNNLGYRGPMPPPGKPHRYFFELYALDTMLDLKSGATKAELERAMQGHVLGRGELMGTYGR
jgi:Raf kinase inhibitor-like YbhB/YbcL family protein